MNGNQSPTGNQDELKGAPPAEKARPGQLLAPAPKEYVVRRGRDPRLVAMYKSHVKAMWTEDELDFETDIAHWRSNKLSDGDRTFIKHVLAFFAASDGIVNENLAKRFSQEPGLPQAAERFYHFQMTMEDVHAISYAQMIDTLVDAEESARLFAAIHNTPCIRDKAQWALNCVDSDRAFGERLVAMACVEGIFFSGSFCAIFWLKKRGLMPGLAHANELISRDEGLHCDFACLLYNDYTHRLPDATIHAIVRDAVECELAFVRDALGVDLIGMNALEMGSYIRFCADRLLAALGHPRIYHVENPFEWMHMISVEGKTNFFEKKVSEYGRLDSPIAAPGASLAFTTDAPF